MYCRSCDEQLADGAFACTKCGKAPLNGNAYCMSCGAPCDPEAIICVKCGASLSTLRSPLESALGSGQLAQNSRLVVGISAILLGALGIHKFLLGYKQEGIIMLVITIAGRFLLHGIFGIAAYAVGVVGLVEGIIYLTKSDRDFYNTYIANKKPWF